MGLELGIVFALGALVSWGFGDFLIQKTTRKLGDWETLLIVTLFGSIVLAPLIYRDVIAMVALESGAFFALLGMSVAMLFAAILDFEALKKGKLSIVEPILALEVPITALLAFVFISESVGFVQIALISILVFGISLISLKSPHFSRKVWLERGALLAAGASILMGISNFLVGFSSRVTNALVTNWFFDIFILIVSFVYLLKNKKLGRVRKDFGKNKKLVLSMCIFDNFAWIFIAVAASIIPIAIAFALSESYIALAALLGILVNKEVLLRHQKAGLVVTLCMVIILCIITV